MYMPESKVISKLIKSKGFKFYKKIDMKTIGYNNEYLLIYKK